MRTWRNSRPPCEITKHAWGYGAWQYDHQEVLTFHEDGTGSYYLAYAQSERWNLTFRWRETSRKELLLTSFVDHEQDKRHPLKWMIRTGYKTLRGHFYFKEKEVPWGDGSTHHYRYRLTLDRGIDGDSDRYKRTFYAVRRRRPR